MPDAKRFGGGGPPTQQQCSLDDWDDTYRIGSYIDAKAPTYGLWDAVVPVITINMNTVGVETLTAFGSVIDETLGTYEIDIDGSPVTPVNSEQISLGASFQQTVITVIRTVAPGPHTIELKLTVGRNIKIYGAFLKVLKTHCISVT